MSILRYQQAANQKRYVSADEALLQLLLAVLGAMGFLGGWGMMVYCLKAGAPSSEKLLLSGCGLAWIGGAFWVGRYVLRPLWPRRYEGAVGVWAVMLLGIAFLLLLGLFTGFVWVLIGLARIA